MRLSQLIKKNNRPNKFHKIKKKALQSCPQKRAVCIKVLKVTPRKPNSALRRVTWVMFSSTKKRVFAYIPGEGESPLKTHSKVLIRGGTVKDLPGMKYTVIRGQRKFDLPSLETRHSSRSKYGAKKLKISRKGRRPHNKRRFFW